ncbi:MAG TPA: hypothetical protein VFZ38_10615 [Vicinamibacterales bacterium]
MPTLGETRALKPGELPPPGWKRVPGSRLIRYERDDRVAGPAGKPGQNATDEQVRQAAEQWLAAHQAELQGVQGERGQQGEQGPRGADGRDGIPGEPGPAGKPGQNGRPGERGPEGNGIRDIQLSRDGNYLEIDLKDGRHFSFWVRGPRGRDGGGSGIAGGGINIQEIGQLIAEYLIANPPSGGSGSPEVFVQDSDPGAPTSGSRVWFQTFAADPTAFDMKIWRP